MVFISFTATEKTEKIIAAISIKSTDEIFSEKQSHESIIHSELPLKYPYNVEAGNIKY